MANAQYRIANEPSCDDHLGSTRILQPQDLDGRRRQENFAKALHPLIGLFSRAYPLVPKLLELVETLQLNFELERRPAVSARKRNKNASVEPLRASGVRLLSNGVQRALPVLGCDLIGKA